MSSFDYCVHSDLNLIELHPRGVVEISHILSYAQEALSLDVVTEGTIEYYDLSEMANLKLDYRSASALTKTLEEWLSRGWEGSVYYAPRDYQFGMIRMIGVVADFTEGAPTRTMIPSRRPIALSDVRQYIAEHRQIS